MFLEGLRGLDPRTDFCEKVFGQRCRLRQQSKKNFVSRSWVGKLSRALRLLPAPAAKFAVGLGPKPLFLEKAFVAQPFQALTLRAPRNPVITVRFHPMHVWAE